MVCSVPQKSKNPPPHSYRPGYWGFFASLCGSPDAFSSKNCNRNPTQADGARQADQKEPVCPILTITYYRCAPASASPEKRCRRSYAQFRQSAHAPLWLKRDLVPLQLGALCGTNKQIIRVMFAQNKYTINDNCYHFGDSLVHVIFITNIALIGVL